MSDLTTLRGRVGAAVANKDPKAEAEARKALAAAKLSHAINEALAAFPPLDDETKAAAAHLLMNGGAS